MLADCYKQHKQQPTVWQKFLLLRQLFLQQHATAPVVGPFCQQQVHTVSLVLCWFHVKQAWNENCKVRLQEI